MWFSRDWLWRFWSEDEKEVVVGNADESLGIELILKSAS